MTATTATEQPAPAAALSRLIGWVAIPVMVFAAYRPSVTGRFLWDDDMYVHANPLVTEAAGLPDIWTTNRSPQYYPLVFTTFWLEWRIWDGNTTGYHLVNLLLHSINALLFWRALRLLGLGGAWLAAALFALHPMHVESVAWITQRKNVLSGMFYLLSFLTFWCWVRKGQWRWYAASLPLFGCALLSKTATVMLPAVLVVVLWWAGRLRRRQDLLALLPFFAMSAVMSAVTIAYETQTVGAQGIEWSAGLAERAAVAGRIIWFYLYKFILPLNLMFSYPRWDVDPAVWASYIPAGGVLLAGVVMLWRRASWDRAMLAGLGTFVVTLFPVLGFFNIYYMRYAFVADHFVYLPGTGAIALVVCGIAHLTRHRRNARAIGAVWGAVLLLAFGTLSYRQNRIFRDPETLYLDTLEKNPDSWLAHNNLGNILMDRGDSKEAISHFHRARQLNPSIQKPYFNEQLAWVRMGRYEEAMEVLREGIRNYKAKDNVRISLELAWLLATCPDERLRDSVEAVVYAEAVARTTKYENAEALDVLAAAYAESGRFDSAVRVARSAVAKAEASGLHTAARAYRERLLLYEQGRPYHRSREEPWRPRDSPSAPPKEYRPPE